MNYKLIFISTPHHKNILPEIKILYHKLGALFHAYSLVENTIPPFLKPKEAKRGDHHQM
jgi:hypothetical protein